MGAGCTLTRWYSNTNKLAFGFAPKVDLEAEGGSGEPLGEEIDEPAGNEAMPGKILDLGSTNLVRVKLTVEPRDALRLDGKKGSNHAIVMRDRDGADYQVTVDMRNPSDEEASRERAVEELAEEIFRLNDGMGGEDLDLDIDVESDVPPPTGDYVEGWDLKAKATLELLDEAGNPAGGFNVYADEAKTEPLALPKQWDLRDFVGTETWLPENIYIEADTNFVASATTPRATRLALKLESTKGEMTEEMGLMTAQLVPDWNRDGKIDEEDRGKVTQEKPWRWWKNDDNDEGDEAFADWPGQYSGDEGTGADAFRDGVDGRCDLADFFPVLLDIGGIVERLPEGVFQLRVSHPEGAANVVFTDLGRNEAGSFLTKDFSVGFGPELASSAECAMTGAANEQGTPVPETFLRRIAEGQDKGVILVEGRMPSKQPLALEIWQGTRKLGQVALPLSIDGVERMYRWVNLRPVAGQAVSRATDVADPANLPDVEGNGKMFIFVHGYNVDELQSRGWAAEVFKRLYQSGSRSPFTAVSWHGDSSQVPILELSADYWENVTHAFETAPALADAIEDLPGSSKIVAAHSLGNMVICSAISDHGMSVGAFFMLNAAVAMEAFDATEVNVPQMRNPSWLGYTNRLWSTEWHKLFPESDGRRGLSWRDRFVAMPAAYNFYSSGEDVLQNGNGTVPSIPRTEGIWARQEMTKGTADPFASMTFDSQGGWGFNLYSYTDGMGGRMPPDAAASIPDEQLRIAPFFTRFQETQLMDPMLGSAAASDPATRAKTLGDAIPALSFALGRNPISKFGQTRNRNLMLLKNAYGAWPDSREHDRWLHGDAKDVAFRFNYMLYKDLAELGGLK